MRTSAAPTRRSGLISGVRRWSSSTSADLDPAAGELPAITLKLEQLQCAGSFKARGAFANLLLRDVPPAGVVAASGGNHGVAVAYAAHRLGVPARIFVPTVSAPAKMERIRQLGAELVVTGDRYADALAAAQAWVAELGRDERARLRPAGNAARPGHRGPRADWASRIRWTRYSSRSAAAG